MLKLRVLHLNNNLLKLINLIAGKREHPRLILREIHFIIMIDLGWIVVFKNDHNRKAIRWEDFHCKVECNVGFEGEKGQFERTCIEGWVAAEVAVVIRVWIFKVFVDPLVF